MNHFAFQSAIALSLCLVLGSCGSGDPADSTGPVDTQGQFHASDFPAIPTNATNVLFVSVDAPIEGANGSLPHPFPTIAAAVQAAMPGYAILIASGTYKENVVITQDAISLIGTDEIDAEQITVKLEPPAGQVGIFIQEVENVSLRGLSISGSTTAGVWVSGSSALIEGCLVQQTIGADEESFAVGILATADSSIDVRYNHVKNSEEMGVMLVSSNGTIEGNTIEGNNAGGIRIEQSDDVLIQSNEIVENQLYGIGIFSAGATIVSNHIEGTFNPDPNSDTADGIIVTFAKASDDSSLGDSQVEIGPGNTIKGNERLGILMSTGAMGTIEGNQVLDNGRSGIWLQAQAGGAEGIRVKNNESIGNRYIGIGLTGGARAIIRGNLVENTQLGPDFDGFESFDQGDGIGVFNDAAALVEANNVSVSGRVGIILDSPAGGGACGVEDPGFTTAVCGNEVLENNHGIIIQHAETDIPTLNGNSLVGNLGGDEPLEIGPEEVPFPLIPEALNGFGAGGTFICVPPDCQL